jgi:hypothetical protein
MRTGRSKKGKTYKREAGFGAGVAWLVISARFWTLGAPDLVSAYGAAYGAVTLFTFSFVAGLLGLDWQHRQNVPAQAEADYFRRSGRWSAADSYGGQAVGYGAPAGHGYQQPSGPDRMGDL